MNEADQIDPIYVARDDFTGQLVCIPTILKSREFKVCTVEL